MVRGETGVMKGYLESGPRPVVANERAPTGAGSRGCRSGFVRDALAGWAPGARTARRFSAAAGLALVLAMQAPGADEARPLAEDPALEARLEGLAAELRCLVCQNESIAESRTDLAEDLRREVRGLLREGRSDEEVLEFLTSRYGDFILYRPPFRPATWLLWLGPPLILVFGGAGFAFYLRYRGRLLAAQTDPPAREPH
jgi:cytochrome c-type biogenesis protein CcmH